MDELSIIEDAARAAGLLTRRHRVRDVESVHVCPKGGAEWRHFNPLTRDADTSELVAAVRIDVYHESDFVSAFAGQAWQRVNAFDQVDPDKMPDDEGIDRRRALRRAVTECAARVGASIGAYWWRQP